MAEKQDILRLTILGCGSSAGVPRITGDWGACDPENPKNRRLRCSVLVERIRDDGKRTTVVIDTGPDFRRQMLVSATRRLDAIVYTHAHADHIHGIDDLRGYVLQQRARMPIYADANTLKRLKGGFDYCFATLEGSGYPPIVDAHEICAGQPFMIEGEGGSLTFEPLLQSHGGTFSLAFRIGPFAYCTDVSSFPAETAKRLAGLDYLVIGALQYKRHPSHFSLEEALEWIAKLKPHKKSYLTHMHIPLDYQTVLQETPDDVEPAYDMLRLEVPAPRY